MISLSVFENGVFHLSDDIYPNSSIALPLGRVLDQVGEQNLRRIMMSVMTTEIPKTV